MNAFMLKVLDVWSFLSFILSSVPREEFLSQHNFSGLRSQSTSTLPEVSQSRPLLFANPAQLFN